MLYLQVQQRYLLAKLPEAVCVHLEVWGLLIHLFMFQLDLWNSLLNKTCKRKNKIRNPSLWPQHLKTQVQRSQVLKRYRPSKPESPLQQGQVEQFLRDNNLYTDCYKGKCVCNVFLSIT